MNCPIDPKTMEISGKKRIEESIPTIESLTDSKLVIASTRAGLVIQTIRVWQSMQQS